MLVDLKNPLGGFDEYSKLLNELIKKKSSTSSKHHDVLKKLEEDFQKAQALEPGDLKTKIFEKIIYFLNDRQEYSLHTCVQLRLIYQTVFGTWFLDLANACLNR
jgi:predicted alternative tryptophan synthase beta-subunit